MSLMVFTEGCIHGDAMGFTLTPEKIKDHTHTHTGDGKGCDYIIHTPMCACASSSLFSGTTS